MTEPGTFQAGYAAPAIEEREAIAGLLVTITSSNPTPAD